jgi:hypothetical protein
VLSGALSQSLYLMSGFGEKGELGGEELYGGKSDEQLRNGGGGGGEDEEDCRRRRPGGGNGIEILTAGRRAAAGGEVGNERARAARWARYAEYW